jgi:hypothetical protein
VVLASAWPIISWMTRNGVPAAAICVPNVCRRSWKRITRTPASSQPALDGEWRDEVMELLDHERLLLLGAGDLLESS